MERLGLHQSFKDNIISYLMLIPVCLVFGLIYSAISNWINLLGWIFVILTAGLFYFSGGYFVEQGYYGSNKWKVFFVLMIPIFFFIDYQLMKTITWHNIASTAAYYFIFTLGLVFKKIPRQQIKVESIPKVEILKDLKCNPSNKTPFVAFRADGDLYIKGRSIMENAFLTYDPLIEWIEEYCKCPAKTTTLNLMMDYFNGDGFKYLMIIIQRLRNLPKENEVIINWYFEIEDDDMLELAETFDEMTTITINKIPLTGKINGIPDSDFVEQIVF